MNGPTSLHPRPVGTPEFSTPAHHFPRPVGTAEPSLPGPHNIVEATLSNGLRVWVYENFTSPTVVIDASTPGGAAAEGLERAGLASLSATLLRRGTRQRDYDTLNEAVETVGAHYGFDCGRHVLGFGAKSLSEDVDLVLELLAESLMEPAFPVDQLEQVRASVLTSIQERQHNPRSMASLTFNELIYGNDHPYGWSLLGYEKTVTAFSRADLETFYRHHCTPAGGVIVIAGALSAGAAVAALERTVGQWRHHNSGPAPADPAHHSPLREPKERRLSIPGKSQSSLILGWPGIPRRHADYFPMLICNAILGRFGMGGRLGRNIRERQGMAYYAYSTFATNRYAGAWFAAAGVNPAHVDQTIQTILQEVECIRQEPVSDQELDDVKANLTGSLPLDLETNGGIASTLVDMAWYDLGLDYLVRYSGTVQAVTREDVLRVAQTYLHPDRYVLTVAGP